MPPAVQSQMIHNIKLLLALAKKIEIPILVTEQYPKGLGETIPELKGALDDNYSPITKLSFSCCGEERFPQKLQEINKSQMIVTGMETHVCVLQTALGILAQGYQIITSTETIIFQLLEKAGTDEFKYMSPLLKGP